MYIQYTCNNNTNFPPSCPRNKPLFALDKSSTDFVPNHRLYYFFFLPRG